MKAVLGIATCIWWFMMVLPSLAIRDAVVLGQQQLGVYETATFDLEDGVTGYAAFLKDLRSKFAGPLKSCSLPVTRTKLQIPEGGEYVLAHLKISSIEWVTVALRVSDLYLVAYRVNKLYNGKYQAIFLNEPDLSDARANLFKDGTQLVRDYDSNYGSIEGYAREKRKDITLGVQELRKKIKGFYNEDKAVTPIEEAKFFLIAIQMVAEAARYSYIEDMLVNRGDYVGFKPDAKMLELENDWQKISEIVHKAEEDKLCASEAVVNIKEDTKLLLRKKRPKPKSVDVFSDELIWSVL